MTQPQGEQVADLVSFNRDDTREILSMLCSRAVNLSYKFTAPMTLYSNLSREMWKIDEDLTGENYCGGGYCSEHMNMRRYGDKAKGRRTASTIWRRRSAATAWTAGISTSTPASTCS